MISIRMVNVGLVRDATVKIDDLSVIMGMNNSGKSTVATVLYAAVKAAGALRDRTTMYQPSFGKLRVRDEIHTATDAMVKAIRRVTRVDGFTPEDSMAAIAESSPAVLEAYGHLLVSEIERGLGATADEIPTRTTGGRRLPARVSISTPGWELRVRLAAKGATVTPTLHRGVTISPDPIPLFALSMDGPDGEADARFVADYGIREVIRALFEGFPKAAHYLPAARSGLLQSHRLVAAAMIQRSSLVGIQELSMPSLSGVVADFVSEVLVVNSQRRGRLANEATRIERSVLRGTVTQADTGTGYPELEFRDSHGSHPIHRTSSMVSELAPVVLLLKSAVSPGDVFILEEPESHLHPAAQVELAKAVYAISRRGVRVFLTTHSDFFLATLDNIMRESRIKRNRRVPRTSAYWLTSTDEGSILSPIEVHPVEGIAVDSFTDVASELYNVRVDQQDILEARGDF